MTRRFPPPIPGLPKSQTRYRAVLEALDEMVEPPTRTQFVPRCKAAIEAAEGDKGTTLSDSWTNHIINDLIRSGFIREYSSNDGDVIELGIDSRRWLDGNITFDDFVFKALKRGWVLKANHPEGFEALERILHAVAYELDGGPTSSREIRATLESEYDYQFSEQGLRGYIPILEQIGYLTETDEGLVLPDEVDPDTALGRFRRADVFRKLENRLRREGAMVEPPSKAGKRDMMKYYMYRESGGWRKRKQWYQTFHRNYLTPKARKGAGEDPELDRKQDFPDTEDLRSEYQNTIANKFGIEKNKLQKLSVTELERIKDIEDPNEARRTFIECGSGIGRTDLVDLVSDDRHYEFDDEFELYDWQTEAAEDWFAGTETTASREGIAEVVTGAGKTVMALEVIRRWLNQAEDGVVTIVVPTRVLMYQWLTELSSKLNVPVEEIGWAGDGNRHRFDGEVRILVTIVNTAVKDDYLATILNEIDNPPHLLIADECHNYTGEVHSNVLQYHNTATLGLSATPTNTPHSEREPSPEEQFLFEQLGPVYYRLTYSEAIDRELIPSFEIKYVGFDLTAKEQDKYESLSREISDALKDIRARYSNRLHQLNGNLHQKLNVIRNNDDSSHPAIGNFFNLTKERRDLVQNAISRQAVTLELLQELNQDKKMIVFQEKIEQLEQLIAPREHLGITREREVANSSKYNYRSQMYADYPKLKEVDQQMEDLFKDPGFWPVMYHSGHRRDIWNQFAMEWFRADDLANVMYSVKALIEGVDVPDADIGIIRVSSGSIRQRIQTLGRILRTGNDPDSKSELYVLYARDTVEENIFKEYDWDEQLGNAELTHMEWATDENPLDGTIRETNDPLPDGQQYEEPDYPDIDELEIGDSYSGPTRGYKISVDAEGRPFEKTADGRKFITNPEVADAADIVHDRKGGGSIIINDRGHMLTQLPEETLFLGVTDGPESFTYDEQRQHSLTEDPPSYDDIFSS